VIDPRPSPWIDPGPMAITIWRPSRRHVPRSPHVAVLGNGLPRSELVEILISDDFGCDIARRDRSLVTTLPRQRPALEFVDRRKREKFVIPQISAVETERLTGGDSIGRAFTVRFAFAGAHRD